MMKSHARLKSRADLAHEVSIAAKELREPRYWLRFISQADLASGETLDPLVMEAGERSPF
jgi:four helix bundle protein